MNSKGKGLGLFSKLSRKSLSDLSEWNKNDDRLMQCVERSDLKEIVTLLKKKKLCSTKLDPQGHSALHVAAMRNKYDVVQLLIAYSANVTAVDFQGRTALHCAARHGASEVLEVLSHSKEDDWPRDESNMTALHHACIGGNLDCVINLIRKYPKDIQTADEEARTPLFYSAQIGHLSVCKELLDRGANVNTQDKFGRTALMCAAENGNRLICELFVKKGADVNIRDALGRTASWHAMDAGHTAVKQTIEPHTSGEKINEDTDMEYTGRGREHSPIPEESESVVGDDDTLPLRFRSGSNLEELRISEEEEEDEAAMDVELLSGGDSDDEFKMSDTDDDDGSISPRLSELSYTMSHMKDESSIAHHPGNLTPRYVKSSSRNNSQIFSEDQTDEAFPLSMLDLETGISDNDASKPIMITDLDTDNTIIINQKEASKDNHSTTSHSLSEAIPSSEIPEPHLQSAEKLMTLNQGKSAVNTSGKVKSGVNQVKSDILTTEGISLSTDSSLSSDEDTEVPTTSSQSITPLPQNDLKLAHESLLSNYDSLKSDYEQTVKRLNDLEKERRRHSQEEQEVTERMDMVIQLSELSSKLDDEEARNRLLQAQITTLENLAAGAGTKAQESNAKKRVEDVPENWFDVGDVGEMDEDDSDDEFGFPGLCLLNNSSGKLIREEVKPIAKVSGRPRQMSLKEENREIAKLKTEIESVERQKHSLTEALTQLQSKYEESEHGRKKLLSELDISKTTLDVKSQENIRLSTENEELTQSLTKYKERSVSAVEQTKSYKKEIEKLTRKLELYDREYRKVKERLKRRDANEKRMLKNRQTLMRKLDESVRRMKESESSLEALRQTNNEEADGMLVKCEELESELVILKDFNEDQNDEIERLTELSSCSEEMLDLKQLEIQSLEKQISLLRDVSLAPQRRDSIRDTQKTIKSLQEQITKLQSQLAETAESYQDTIEIYRNNLIMASRNMLDLDVKEALLHIVEVRKAS